MHADPGLKLATPLHAQQPGVAFGAVAVCIVAVLAVFWPTTLSMVEIWRRSETFQHCFAVLPISLWLIWRDRSLLAAQPAQACWPALALVAGFGAMWLLGELGSAQVVSQFAVVGMAVASVLAAFGGPRFRVMWFPLLFLFFAVPFGEFLVPKLIDWTADFTVLALQLTGIPVYREANNFVIPSGNWSVVEACSGIRYLIASLMSGSLFAWLMYRSTTKRVVFVLASLAVPILANWLRAYGIVMLGHLSGNQIATGVDHLVYGWLFFGVVMLLMFWIGARWRDDDLPQAPPAPTAAPVKTSGRTAILAAVLVTVGVWPAAAAVLEAAADERPVRPVAIEPANGWARASGPVSGWVPSLEGPAATQSETFTKGDRRVTVFAGLYRNQRQGSELVNSQNVIARPDDKEWKIVARGTLPVASDPVGTYPASVVRGRDGQFAIIQWYWLGNGRSTSDARGKLDLAIDRLLMRGDTSAWMAVQTPAPEGLEAAKGTLRDFFVEMGPAVDQALAETARR